MANQLQLKVQCERDKANDMENISTFILLNNGNEEQAKTLQKEANQMRQSIADMVIKLIFDVILKSAMF